MPRVYSQHFANHYNQMLSVSIESVEIQMKCMISPPRQIFFTGNLILESYNPGTTIYSNDLINH